MMTKMTTQGWILYMSLMVILLVGALMVLYYVEMAYRGGREGFAGEKDANPDADADADPGPGPFITLYDQERAELDMFGSEGSKGSAAEVKDHGPIPRILWTFWEGPENHVVKYCIASWKYYNPDYEVVVLNKRNYRNYIGSSAVDVDALRHSGDGMARYSDYVRCLVLSAHGGIWIDSSVICHAPFDWVHACQQRTGAEFVGYYIHKGTFHEFRSYSPMVENWFFACVPGSVFMRDWTAEFFRTNEFPTITGYLDNVKAGGTHFNNMANIGAPDYLTMHIAGQKVLQDARDAPRYRLSLFSACACPFLYLHRVNWDVATAVHQLMNEPTRSEYFQCAFVKLRSIERSTLEQYDDAQKRRAFSCPV